MDYKWCCNKILGKWERLFRVLLLNDRMCNEGLMSIVSKLDQNERQHAVIIGPMPTRIFKLEMFNWTNGHLNTHSQMCSSGARI